jgi:gliding motility-associated-like protein
VSSAIAGGPVHYVENKNQWPAGFHFGAEFSGTRVFLRDASVYFIQYRETFDDAKTSKKLNLDVNEAHVHGNGELSLTTFELTFLNTQRPAITASGQQKTLYNYYFGNDRTKWGQGAHAWGEVLYHEMYKGIDLKMYSENEQMKYDWIVSPCADPRLINFVYNGIEDIDLVNENLVITSKLGEVVETKPVAYQMVNGQRRLVPAAFDIDNGVVSFVFPQGYDPNYELVIDPLILFSSYSGSTLDNWGNSATPDSHGNLHSGGMVHGLPSQTGFPTTAGAWQQKHAGGEWDVGILKYDSLGANVLYVTYLGANGVETPQSLVVNQNDELLILGATSSTNFPGTAPNTFKGGTTVDPLSGVNYVGGTDLFIARLSEDGSQLLASTYLGGAANDGINFISGNMGINNGKVESPLARNYGDQLRGDILTDAEGFVYIATNTASPDFPVVNTDPEANFHGGSHDAVVAKLTPSLDVIWTRLMGGSNTDVALSVKLSPTGNIFVGGGTASTNMAGMNGLHPTAPGNTDGWIAELSPNGEQIINATYVGTSGYDQVYFIDIGTTGDVFAYGQTMGDYPIAKSASAENIYTNTNGGQFLHRFTPDLKTAVFSTVFGKGNNRPDISPTAFLVSACDNIYMAGWGGSVNAPIRFGVLRNYVGGTTNGLQTTPDALQPVSLGGNDFYLMVLSGDASTLLYATFLGGAESPTHVDGGTSRFDKTGIVYHAVCAGCGGRPTDFPSFNVPAERSQNRSQNCNNAAFKFDLSALRAGLKVNNVVVTGTVKVCFPDPVIFQNTSVGGELFQWKFGDRTTDNRTDKVDIVHKYAKPGRYNVTLKAIDHSTCASEDSVSVTIEVFQADMNGGPDKDICFGSSTKLEGTGAATYLWRTIDNRFTSTVAQPTVAPEDSTTYYLTMTDVGGCIRKDTVTVNVVPGIELAFDYERQYDCLTRPFLKVTNKSELKDGEEAMFFFGDGTSTGEEETIHNYEQDGEYTVSLRATKEFCVYQVSEVVPIVTFRLPNVITPGSEDGLNDVFRVVHGNSAVPWDLPVGMKIMNRWGKLVFETNDYKNDWNGADVDAGTYYYEADIHGEVQCKGWIQLIK